MTKDRRRRGPGPGRPQRPGGPQGTGPGGPRPERPPRRGGQADAVNRSRPIYDAPAGRNRFRRPGPRPTTSPNGGPRDREEREAPPLPTNPREAALRILHAVDTRSAFSDRMLDGAHARGGPDERDAALMHELVKGTLRWRGRIDYVLDQRIHIGLSQVQPWVRNVLRIGAYQLLFLDRIPAHAAVDESVKLAHKYGHPGTAGLVNSVLRRLVEEKDAISIPEGDDAESLSIWGSHPLWIVERWLQRFGPDATRALLEADNRPVPVGLRANRMRVTREQLIERLASEGAAATAGRLSEDLVWLDASRSPGALKAFREGVCTAQDESECLVAALVAPAPHDRILDLCAAPGGKCTHLAERIGDEGEVWALERAEARVASLEATIKRLGLHCIHVVHGDGRQYEFPMPFDRVLVDAPCSGLGVLGRRADARWRKGPEVLREMPPLQLELLSAAGQRARPGGALVYSVCSFEPEETDAIVERFLRTNPSFILESAAPFLPAEVVDEQGFMRVLPHVHGCDGAFAARFRKT
jgi:16S rRNA (cytosine967-C5)-methyltransferase